MRKSYGTTWWGKQWLNALQNIDFSNRLPRGRTYANKGAVQEIHISGNRITALVQGSRPRPYQVEVEIPPFTAPEKARIIEEVTANPLFLSQLLNRELPQELHEACSARNVQVFPASWSDIEGHCSCPDLAVPCKHLAAVLYLIANEIDKNPFLAFELHRFDLFEGLQAVGYADPGHKEVDIPALDDLLQEESPQTDDELWDSELFAQLDFTLIPDCREQLLRILAPQAVFYPQGDFGKKLHQVYRQVARYIKSQEESEWDDRVEEVENMELTLDEKLGWVSAKALDIRGREVRSFSERNEFVEWLRSIPLNRLQQVSPEVRGLALAFRLAEHLAEKSAFIPQLLSLPDGAFLLRWLPAWLQEDVWETADLVEMLCPGHLLRYRIGKERLYPTEEDAFPALISLFLNHFVHTANPFGEVEPILMLFFSGTPLRFEDFQEREIPTSIQLWLNRLYLTEKPYVPVVQVEELSENRFSLGLAVEKKEEGLEPPFPLYELFEKEGYRDVRLELLRDLAQLAEFFPQISRITASRGREVLKFDSQTFVEVLLDILPTIRLLGIRIMLPKALRKLIRPQLSMRMEGESQDFGVGAGLVSLENMLRFQWQVALGEASMSKEEFLQKVQQLTGIVRLYDQYVYFDENEVQKLVEKLEQPPELKGPQLLQAALTEEYRGARVELDEQAQQTLQDLMRTPELPPPSGLQATLRPYQQRGFEWLYKNARLGLGSLIADDMGLGKTLQVITLLLQLKEEGALDKGKALIIVPTTLLTNWQKEIERFAPELRAHLYHGPGRSLDPLQEGDLLLTTYGLARRDKSKLKECPWLLTVIDEAQNIKNPRTGQTKAVKQISAPLCIAMSGTPVENRLSEYWSIMDFANPGYLGKLAHFKDEFARPIEQDRDQKQLQRFRRITQPFILRRLKTDKSIISDLPDKIEQNQYCQLTSEQAALYQSVLDNTLEAVEQAEGINRRGMVLKLITALKQVCNHPAHFLKKGPREPGLSGKGALLMELLEQVLEQDEKALIFTQYREMGDLINHFLQQRFGWKAPFLHGGVSRSGRDEMVEYFQHNRHTRILLLSLKAGGTGLNLTAAGHVIHYDLWWNPAVENQATDRAYRIGQQRNVQVHRFITQNTFEEKIDRLLQAKKELAELSVTTGEKWIGELSNKELRELVKMG